MVGGCISLSGLNVRCSDQAACTGLCNRSRAELPAHDAFVAQNLRVFNIAGRVCLSLVFVGLEAAHLFDLYLGSGPLTEALLAYYLPVTGRFDSSTLSPVLPILAAVFAQTSRLLLLALALALIWKALRRSEAQVLLIWIGLLLAEMEYFGISTTLFGHPSEHPPRAFTILPWLHGAVVSTGSGLIAVTILWISVRFPQTSLSDRSPAHQSNRVRLSNCMSLRSGGPCALLLVWSVTAGLEYGIHAAKILKERIPYRLEAGIISHEVMEADMVRIIQWTSIVMLITAIVWGWIFTVAFRNLRGGWQKMPASKKREMLWLVQGLSIWIGGVVLAAVLLAVSATVGGPLHQAAGWLIVRVAGCGMAICFALAIFYDGAIDPSLTLRKSSIYGSLGLLLVAIFVSLEVATSHLFSQWAGLPFRAESLIAGTMVGVAFFPLRRRVESRVESWISTLIPPNSLAEEGRRRQSVVAFSDLVGYSAISTLDEKRALTLVALFHTTARTVAADLRGNVVKTIGDGVLLEFSSAQNAIDGCRALHQRFAAGCVALGLDAAAVRTGIHSGTVVEGRGGDIFGDVVNVAARLEQIAFEGEIVASEAVRGGLTPATQKMFGEGEVCSLKNIQNPVQCFRYLVEKDAKGTGFRAQVTELDSSPNG